MVYMPKVSVVIPTYNRAEFLMETVHSVLDQTYRDFEIIVVDDGSTDTTAQVLEPYSAQVRYVWQENAERSAARNHGLRLARGEYIAFLDDDDRFLPDKLRGQVAALDRDPGIGLVASGFQYTDEHDTLIGEEYPWVGRSPITLQTILFSGLAPIHAVLARRESITQVGGFDTHIRGCEDIDLWLKLSLAGCRMAWEPAIVCQYRLHANNWSRSPELHFMSHRQALDKAFADPRMPADLRRRRPQIDAQLDLSEASRLSAGGWDEAARDRIRRALQTDPGLAADNGRRLAEIAAGLQASVWGNGRFSEFVVAATAGEIPGLERTMKSVAAKKRFYTAFSERRAVDTRQAWIDVARQDPRWLLNRGGWSILYQSLQGLKE